VVAYYGAPVTAVAVQGASTPAAFNAPSQQGANPLEYFGVAVQSLSPVTVMVLAMLAIVGVVGVAAHNYRNKLPKLWQSSWRKHHGMVTFIGMLSLGALIIIATGGGSI